MYKCLDRTTNLRHLYLLTRHINSQSEIRYSEKRSDAKRIRFASRPKIFGPFALFRFRFFKKRIRYSENFRFFFAVIKKSVKVAIAKVAIAKVAKAKINYFRLSYSLASLKIFGLLSGNCSLTQ